MKKNKNIYYILFVVAAAIMAIIYFSVPERGVFLENQIQWWSEMWNVIRGSA